MNKKVLKTMVVLVGTFIFTCYILKIFFPEQFVMAIENETLISIGNYIDTHAWAEYSFGILTSFITYWLYLCAVCHRWYLKWWECLIVLGVIGTTIGLNFVDVNLVAVVNYTSFIFLPAIFGSDLKSVAVCYTVHIASQYLTLSIRNLPVYMTAVNSLILNVAICECFFWLLLLYFLFNYNSKKKTQEV